MAEAAREESLTFACGELTLEGMVHRPAQYGRAWVVVCHPHPLYGGDMDNPVVVSVCRELAALGLTALRFNFRGVGASRGAFAGGVGEQEDLRAALDTLAGLGGPAPSRIGLAGYSFGAVVASAVAPADGRVDALALISPPPQNLALPALGRWLRPVLLVTGERDAIAPPESLRQVAQGLPQPAELLVLAGADHFWRGRASEPAQAVAAFFQRWLADG